MSDGSEREWMMQENEIQMMQEDMVQQAAPADMGYLPRAKGKGSSKGKGKGNSNEDDDDEDKDDGKEDEGDDGIRPWATTGGGVCSATHSTSPRPRGSVAKLKKHQAGQAQEEELRAGTDSSVS